MPLERRPELERAVQAAMGSDKAAQRKAYAEKWVQQPGLHEVLFSFGQIDLGWGIIMSHEFEVLLSRALRDKNKVNHEFVDKLQPFFRGHPVEPKYYSLGAGAHGGYGPGLVGAEAGAIWNANSFGRVPMHDPIADYSDEWVTAGIPSGFDLGVSVDMMALTTWFGRVNQIDGHCNGVTFTGSYYGGLSVTLFWDGSWGGAEGTEHPIGVSVISSAGIEIGGGVFYNSSWTQFFNKRPNFPT